MRSIDERRAMRAEPVDDRPQIQVPEDAAELLLRELRDRDRERCALLALDTKHRLIELVVVSVGTVNRTYMSAREVYRDALLLGASAIVLGHNHPSGELTPSADDLRVTKNLTAVGEELGVPLLDHLIVAGEQWISLTRRSLTQEAA
ncbi:MAG: JAB domain-containing protein [Actinomycetota bacterium]